MDLSIKKKEGDLALITDEMEAKGDCLMDKKLKFFESRIRREDATGKFVQKKMLEEVGEVDEADEVICKPEEGISLDDDEEEVRSYEGLKSSEENLHQHTEMLTKRLEGNSKKQVELVTEGKTDGKDANKIIGVPYKLPTLHTPLSEILATMLTLEGSSGMQEGQMSIRKSVLSVEKNSLVQDVTSNKYSVEDEQLSKSSPRETKEVKDGLIDVEVSVRQAGEDESSFNFLFIGQRKPGGNSIKCYVPMVWDAYQASSLEKLVGWDMKSIEGRVKLPTSCLHGGRSNLTALKEIRKLENS